MKDPDIFREWRLEADITPSELARFAGEAASGISSEVKLQPRRIGRFIGKKTPRFQEPDCVTYDYGRCQINDHVIDQSHPGWKSAWNVVNATYVHGQGAPFEVSTRITSMLGGAAKFLQRSIKSQGGRLHLEPGQQIHMDEEFAQWLQDGKTVWASLIIAQGTPDIRVLRQPTTVEFMLGRVSIDTPSEGPFAYQLSSSNLDRGTGDY